MTYRWSKERLEGISQMDRVDGDSPPYDSAKEAAAAAEKREAKKETVREGSPVTPDFFEWADSNEECMWNHICSQSGSPETGFVAASTVVEVCAQMRRFGMPEDDIPF